ncbi:MAG TPA: hypothetical protein VGM44_19180 [Polyangiaceae bacterium]|jgi:hypothetical protein
MTFRSLSLLLGVVGLASAIAAGCGGADFAGATGGSSGAGGVGVAGSVSAGNAGDVSASSGASGTRASGGQGGVAGSHASAGSSANNAGASDGGAAGESTGAGGTSVAGASTGGASGSSAGAIGDAGAGGCTQTWFPDSDGDGYGRSSGAVLACDPPTSGSWVLVGGDCNDDNKLVFPKNPNFYSDGYTTAGNAISFDYDCSTAEEEDPSARGAAPVCNNTLNCPTGAGKAGFQGTGRSGPGVNGLCGSKTLVTCVNVNLTCSPVTSAVSTGAPCH